MKYYKLFCFVQVAALLTLVALTLAYLVTLIPWLKLKSRSRTTVAVETSMQNAQIAATVIELTAENRICLFIQMVLFSSLYYVFEVGYAVIFILFTMWLNVKSKAESEGIDIKKKKEDTKAARNHEAENPAYEDTQSA